MYKKEAEKRMAAYYLHMTEEGLAPRTITQYMISIEQWLSGQTRIIDRESMQTYKQALLSEYALRSVNLKLISVNRYLRWLGHGDLIVKVERMQSDSSLERVITGSEYDKMIEYARKTNRMKMFYIMRTIALTGIRVGELRYITVEAVKSGAAAVYNKGKHRQIYLPPKLCHELLQFCAVEGIETGVVFYGKTRDRPISASGVWRNLQYIADRTAVPLKNVYPHSFRHLFAKTYMSEIGDITELSDLLGHSRLETTRIYTRTSADEKRRNLDQISL